MVIVMPPILMIVQEVTPFIMKANQCKALNKSIRKMLDSHLLALITLITFFGQLPYSWSADDAIILEIKRKGGHVFSDFGQIIEINLNGHDQIEEAWIERISRERGMTDLSLEQTPIGDKEIKLFTHLKKLEWLNLYQTQITDEGLRTIAQLTRLKHLPLGENTHHQRRAQAFKNALLNRIPRIAKDIHYRQRTRNFKILQKIKRASPW